jgi:hypothetical protein
LDHDGFYPVGVCSLIVAESEKQARELLIAELNRVGFNGQKPFNLTLIDTTKPSADILLDGNY